MLLVIWLVCSLNNLTYDDSERSYCQGCEFFDKLGIAPWKILSTNIQLLNTKGITCHVQVYSKVCIFSVSSGYLM